MTSMYEDLAKSVVNNFYKYPDGRVFKVLATDNPHGSFEWLLVRWYDKDGKELEEGRVALGASPAVKPNELERLAEDSIFLQHNKT